MANERERNARNNGIGRHHGIEGLEEFSNPRGVFNAGERVIRI